MEGPFIGLAALTKLIARLGTAQTPLTYYHSLTPLRKSSPRDATNTDKVDTIEPSLQMVPLENSRTEKPMSIVCRTAISAFEPSELKAGHSEWQTSANRVPLQLPSRLPSGPDSLPLFVGDLFEPDCYRLC